jgi:hypothetical protein
MSALISSTEGLEKLLEEGGLTLYRGAAGADGSPLLTVAVTGNVVDEDETISDSSASRPARLAAPSSGRLVRSPGGDRAAAADLLLTDPGGQLLSDRSSPLGAG